MSRSDEELAGDALEHLRVLHLHLERSDVNDQIVADAVSLRLAAAIESISIGSQELRDRVAGDQWPIIRATVEHDLPTLEAALRAEVE